MNNCWKLSKTTKAIAISLALIVPNQPLFAGASDKVENLFEQVKLDYEVFTLDNGLTVLVYPDHKLPEVFVGVYYRVGSKDEPKGKTGFAHLYEHLMFQGTKNAPGEYFDYTTKMGASSVNGTTSTDRTNYYQTVPTGSLDTALWLESDRMANMAEAITQEVLDEQRNVVKNEKRQGAERMKAYDFWLNHFYPKDHPYGHSTIGSMDDLNAASLDDVHQWFKDYYGAQNAVVVLAGDVTIAQAKAKVKKYFSDVPTGQRLPIIDEYIPALSHNKYVERFDNVPTTSVSRSWPLPSSNSKDYVLMRTIARTIAGDKESPLTKILKDELGYVTNISLSTQPGMVSSSLNLNYTVRPEANVSIEKINKIIERELAKYFKKGPDEDFMETLLFNGDVGFIKFLPKTKELAVLLTEELLYKGDPEFFRKGREWQHNASMKEYAQVAKDWMNKPYLQVVTRPQGEIKTMAKTVDRASLPDIKPTIADVEFPEFQETVLKNGMKLRLKEKKGIPLVDVLFSFDTGTAMESNYSKGTASRVFGMLTKGSDDYDELELIREQRDLALSFSASSGLLTSNFGFTALSPLIDESMELAAEVLLNPTYPEKELVKAREAVDRVFDNLEQKPSSALNSLFNRALWGENHEFGKLLTREESKAEISRDNMLAFHKNELGPNNTTVYMVGDISLKEATDLLNEHFDDWKKVEPSSNKFYPKPVSMKGKIILVDAPNQQSATIVAGQMLDKYDASKADILSMANAPLGGHFQSRINMNLREDKGWSYGARSGVNSSPLYEQKFMVTTQVQLDKVVPSIKELRKELNAYVSTSLPTLEEVNLVREQNKATMPSSFKSTSSYIASGIRSEAYGNPFNYAETYKARIDAITLEQVHQAVKDNFKPNELVWMISADLAKVEQQIRDANLGDIEVWDAFGNKLR